MNGFASYDLAEIAGNSHKSTYVPKMPVECRFCEHDFVPKKGSHPRRNWCYEYKCERQRDAEHTKQVHEAAKRREALGHKPRKTRRSRPRAN